MYADEFEKSVDFEDNKNSKSAKYASTTFAVIGAIVMMFIS